MKNQILIPLLFVCSTIYSQKTDTMLYSNDECSNTVNDHNSQNVSFTLKNDTLTIYGRIVANCCGDHCIIYNIVKDSVYLFRLDTGNLCDCYCLQKINLKIGGFTSERYKIHLSGYSVYNGIDTIIYSNQTISCNGNTEAKNIEVYPNPFSKTTIVKFSNPSSDSFTFRIFDCSGKLIKTVNNLGSDCFLIDRENLHNGVYYFRLFNADLAHYTGKLLIQ